jgi:hypothetical protein
MFTVDVFLDKRISGYRSGAARRHYLIDARGAPVLIV